MPTTIAATGPKPRYPVQSPDANGVIGGNVTRTMDYETLTLQSDFNNKFNALGIRAAGRCRIPERRQLFRNSLYNFGGGPTSIRPISSRISAIQRHLTRFKSDSYAMYAQDTVNLYPR